MGSHLDRREIKSTPCQHPRHDAKADYSTWNHANHDQLKDTMWGSCEEALAVVRDAHWKVLVVTALLEDKIGIKLFSQPWSPVLRESQVLKQPLMQIPDWEPSDQSPPGGITPRGVNQEASPVPQPQQLRQWVTFEDNPREDTRTGGSCPLTWGDEEGTGNYLTGLDQKPDQRRTLSACLPLTLSS